jgi:hypothetical protein
VIHYYWRDDLLLGWSIYQTKFCTIIFTVSRVGALDTCLDIRWSRLNSLIARGILNLLLDSSRYVLYSRVRMRLPTYTLLNILMNHDAKTLGSALDQFRASQLYPCLKLAALGAALPRNASDSEARRTGLCIDHSKVLRTFEAK